MLHCGPLASKTAMDEMSDVLGYTVCGTLLQWPQESNTLSPGLPEGDTDLNLDLSFSSFFFSKENKNSTFYVKSPNF